NFIQGHTALVSGALIAAWTLAAALFAHWQFNRTLNFDAQAARAHPVRARGRFGLMGRFYQIPSKLFPDPFGALVEKEIRFLARSPRFRMVFLMGFTFGLVVWLPMVFNRTGDARPIMGDHYLTAVSVYALLLLGEACFWNLFGFDRSA